jgi:hypothetical protein
LFHGHPKTRSRNVRSNFGQWDQDEGAFSQARVRNLQTRLAELDVAEEQNVEIKRSGAVADGTRAVAAKLLFDGQQLVQEMPGLQVGLERYHSVDKSWLADESNRCGGIKPRPRDHAAKRAKPLCRPC